MYKIIYSSQAQKDAKKANEGGLKDNIQKLLIYWKIIRIKIRHHMKN